MARKRENTVDWGGLDVIVRSITTGKDKANPYNLDDRPALGEASFKRNVVNITTSATRTVTEQESGTLFLMNKADGIVFTLPVITANSVGTWYEFQVNTSVTSNAYKWSTGTQGTDFFNGQVLTVDTDTAASPVAHAGNGSTHDNISMSGTTTGGLIGTCIKLTCVSSTLWTVEGFNMASGAVATPFATS